MPLRYKIVDIYDKYYVRVETRKEYIPVMHALQECKRIIHKLLRISGQQGGRISSQNGTGARQGSGQFSLIDR